jgi:hypothetical protein
VCEGETALIDPYLWAASLEEARLKYVARGR